MILLKIIIHSEIAKDVIVLRVNSVEWIKKVSVLYIQFEI